MKCSAVIIAAPGMIELTRVNLHLVSTRRRGSCPAGENVAHLTYIKGTPESLCENADIMKKPDKRKGLNKSMRRTVDILMALVCIAVFARIVWQPPNSEEARTQETQGAFADTASLEATVHVSGTSAAPEPQSSAREEFPLPSKSLMEQGKKLYAKNCVACHQANGEGIPGLFPPVAKSDYLMADKARSIRIILQGQTGEVMVNGVKYNGAMPPIPLKDEQIANVLTYIRNSWGNTGEIVTAEEVRQVRSEINGRSLADVR